MSSDYTPPTLDGIVVADVELCGDNEGLIRVSRATGTRTIGDEGCARLPDPSDPTACPILHPGLVTLTASEDHRARGFIVDSTGMSVCSVIRADVWEFSVSTQDWSDAAELVRRIAGVLDRYDIAGSTNVAVRRIPWPVERPPSTVPSDAIESFERVAAAFLPASTRHAEAHRNSGLHLLPPTGPVSAGGDQGRDFESYRVEGSGGTATGVFATKVGAADTLVFACTTERGSDADLARMAREDIADAPRARHQLQDWGRSTHGRGLGILRRAVHHRGP